MGDLGEKRGGKRGNVGGNLAVENPLDLTNLTNLAFGGVCLVFGKLIFGRGEYLMYICDPILKLFIMKKEIHPEQYRLCIFKDMSNGYSFLTRSCAETKETLKWEDGNEYPLVKLDISMTSHPFYTGKQVLVDTAGRVDKFRTRYSKKK